MRMRRQRGDTLVEVMIATAVAAALLGGAYATVSHTVGNTRQAQEHGEALGIAQAQIEALPAALAAAPNTLNTGTPFCLNTGVSNPRYADWDPNAGGQSEGPDNAPKLFTGGSFDELNVHNGPAVRYYPTDCQGLGTGGYYRVGVQYFGTNGGYYRVYVTWPSATGSGDDQVTLSYKAE